MRIDLSRDGRYIMQSCFVVHALFFQTVFAIYLERTHFSLYEKYVHFSH